MSTGHRIKGILRELMSEGWTVISKNTHIKLRSPSGKSTLSMSMSPSCRHAHKNIRKDANKIIQKEQNEKAA